MLVFFLMRPPPIGMVEIGSKIQSSFIIRRSLGNYCFYIFFFLIIFLYIIFCNMFYKISFLVIFLYNISARIFVNMIL